MKAIFTAMMFLMALSATASTNYVFTGATNKLSPSFISKCLNFSGATNETLQGVEWNSDEETLIISYGEELSAFDWSIVSNTATWFVTNTSMSAKVDKWKDLKTNYPAILAWEARLTNRLASVNVILISEGIITNAFTPQNSSPLTVGAKVAESTNANIGGLGLALDADVKYLYMTVEKYIGSPPDGSEILIHVPVNE